MGAFSNHFSIHLDPALGTSLWFQVGLQEGLSTSTVPSSLSSHISRLTFISSLCPSIVFMLAMWPVQLYFLAYVVSAVTFTQLKSQALVEMWCSLLLTITCIPLRNFLLIASHVSVWGETCFDVHVAYITLNALEERGGVSKRIAEVLRLSSVFGCNLRTCRFRRPLVVTSTPPLPPHSFNLTSVF